MLYELGRDTRDLYGKNSIAPIPSKCQIPLTPCSKTDFRLNLGRSPLERMHNYQLQD